MNENGLKLQINVNERIFLKDPTSSELGRKIIEQGVRLIDQMGFEHFTFKKLAEEIQSTEASIYRYFENKHKLLVYLLSWYWNWLEHQLQFGMMNLTSPEDRLRAAIRIISHAQEGLPNFTRMDMEALYRIVVSESPKAYLIKEVDEINKEGYFMSYKRICRQVSEVVTAVNPNYAWPRALVSSIVESTHSQVFFSLHLPSLTEVARGDRQQVADFLIELVFKSVK